MIKTICHLADIHIRKSPTRHEEYRQVFNNLYKSLKKQKPDRIVIVGDLFHDYIDLQPEATILASEFLNNLAKIAPTRITRGNHDFLRKNSKRIDAIEAIIKAINNPNVVYYNKTGFYNDENVTWAVWHHGEKNNCPWKKKHDKDNNQIYIDLFHDPINGSRSPVGFELKGKKYLKLSDFKGDYGFFGDIHLFQLLDKENSKAYAGSLISQNFAEGDDDFHGYLLWDIEKKSVKKIEIKNDFSFKTVYINPYTDFDDLDVEIDNLSKYMRIRVVWKTLPDTKNISNERKLNTHIKEKYNPILLSSKNEFIEEDKMDEEENIEIENIADQEIQHNIFKKYLEKIGVEENIIDEVIKLDDEISKRVKKEDFTNIEWDIIKFGGINFMSYQKFDIDWRNMDGLYQISGLNTAGKCVDSETDIEIEFDENEIIKKLGYIPKEFL